MEKDPGDLSHLQSPRVPWNPKPNILTPNASLPQQEKEGGPIERVSVSRPLWRLTLRKVDPKADASTGNRQSSNESLFTKATCSNVS